MSLEKIQEEEYKKEIVRQRILNLHKNFNKAIEHNANKKPIKHPRII